MVDDSKGKKGALHWDQVALAIVGFTSFVLGVSVHSDRSNLAVVLVAFGLLLMLLAALLPRLQSATAKFGGAEFSLNLLPPNPSVSDRVLQQAMPSDAPGASAKDLRNAPAPPSGASGFSQAI